MNHIIIGLGYGDEGKGTIVDYLCQTGEVQTVVRFSGGCQAGHNVVLPDGRHHTFAQFGSGTFVPEVQTYLSSYTLVEPFSLQKENEHLKTVGVDDAMQRLSIDGEALITTPYHWIVNRALEQARGDKQHGTCGRGIGATMDYAISNPGLELRVQDIPEAVAGIKLLAIKDWAETQHKNLGVEMETDFTVENILAFYRETISDINIVKGDVYLPNILATGNVIFEGSQGVLLDQDYGFHPHTTWSSTTTRNADELLKRHNATAHKIGVLRAYSTRHGQGPMPTEDPALNIPEAHTENGWAGPFRKGHFDMVAAKYALKISPVDTLAITHLDVAREHPELRIAMSYQSAAGLTWSTLPTPSSTTEQEELTKLCYGMTPVLIDPCNNWTPAIETFLQQEVEIGSYGPTWKDKMR